MRIYLFFLLSISSLFAQNQTEDTTPIQSPESLPFTIKVEKADFSLPKGLQSFAFGTHKNKWLFISGRINGLHDFSSTNNNFPPNKQNTDVFVVDVSKKKVYTKSLHDETSHLSQKQIDTLSVTSAQFTQEGDTLYLVGGYGVNSENGTFSTKSTLTAIDIPRLMDWVLHDEHTAASCIRQTSAPFLQVTGGYLGRVNPHTPFLLIFGQNFKGFYYDDSNGTYTEQVRPFTLIDNEHTLAVIPHSFPHPISSYRRRDLNVVPIIEKKDTTYESSFLALSGVFTLSGGIWTIPVFIDAKGKTSEPHHTFKQGMNNYDSANIGLFSKKTNDMHILLLGGLTYVYEQDGHFEEDSEIPFTNQITDVKINEHGHFSQYLMQAEYPVIRSTGSNPGNRLLFGAGACFIAKQNIPSFQNGVISLDDLSDECTLGYVIGGIQSTVPNTTNFSDSSASPHIFRVKLKKKQI